MKDPLVSICIPVYNGEKYLRESLDSAIAQTYQNIEIIVVDDQSTDKTVSIVREYALKDKRIRIFLNVSNLGLVRNWNRCIEVAEGEWIKFLFQDDILKSNCIEIYVSFVKMTSGKYPLLVSKRKYLIENPEMYSDDPHFTSRLPTLERIKIKITDNYILPEVVSNTAIKYLLRNFIGEPTSVMFSKAITKELGLHNTSLEQICDLEYVLRIASVYGIVYIPHELTTFRIHDHSTTNRNITQKFYILAYLEPVKLSYLLLFEPAYESLRKYLTTYHLIKLKIYFYVRGYEANLKANKDPVNELAFHSTIKMYPKMEKLKKKSLINKLMYSFLLIKRYFRNDI